MNEADQKLINVIKQSVLEQIHDNFHHWLAWATQTPDESEMQDIQPSSEAMAFITDYMVDQINDGSAEFAYDLSCDCEDIDAYRRALKGWMYDRFGSVSYTNGGDIWMSDEVAKELHELFIQAIKEISNQELTRGI